MKNINDIRSDYNHNVMFIWLIALAKVEAVTGQTPSLPVIKADQKPPALTSDALKLDHDVEPDDDVIKPPTQLVQLPPVRIQL